MNNNHSGPVMQSIEDATNWLSKAKDEFGQDNLIRGELNLNLAQAEVKHAWELSRQQSVPLNSQGSLKKKRNHSWLLPAAAVFVLMGITGFLLINRTENRREPVQRNTMIFVTKDSRNKPVVIQPVPFVQPVKKDIQPLPKENKEIIVKNNPVKIDKSKVDNKTKLVSTVNLVRKEQAPPKVIAELPAEIRETVKQNTSKIQPVSEMTINEEDLTTMASNSLRNGR
jgi:hypothetical protein